MNYTKIKVVLKDSTELVSSEEERTIYQLSGEYFYIIYLNDEGRLHRTDGPAVEWASGSKMWWVNGKEYKMIGKEHNK